MTQRTKAIAASSLVAILTITPLSAQLPMMMGGFPVQEVGLSLSETFKQTIQMIKQLQQLEATYNEVAGHYREALRQGVYLKNVAGRYAHPAAIWEGMNASDTYQRAGRWIMTVNGDHKSAAIAWQLATLNIDPIPGAVFGRMPRLQQDHLSADVTGIDLIDGSAASALESVGKARLSGADAEKTLKRIEEDVLSDTPEKKVLAVQLQHANALALESLKSQGDANRVAVSQAELAAVMLKQQRDASVRALSNEVAFRSAPMLTTNLSGQGFRIP